MAEISYRMGHMPQVNRSVDTKSLDKILLILYEWSGATDSSPDETEVISSDSGTVTLEDLRDAGVIVSQIKNEK